MFKFNQKKFRYTWRIASHADVPRASSCVLAFPPWGELLDEPKERLRGRLTWCLVYYCSHSSLGLQKASLIW